MKILNATFNVSNSDVENRDYTFNASVRTDASTGNIQVEGGMGYRADGMTQVVTFNTYGDSNTSMSFFVPTTEQAEVLAAVNGFINEAKALAAEKFAAATVND